MLSYSLERIYIHIIYSLTCTCTYSYTGSSTTDTRVTTFTKVSKKAAEATCNDGTDYDSTTPSAVTTRKCTLS